MTTTNEPVQDHLGNLFANESAMCKHYNIKQSTFYQRYHVSHWTLEAALTKPVNTKTHKTKTQEVVSVNTTNAKTKPTKDNNLQKFIVQSNYPSQEYLKYLKHELQQTRNLLFQIHNPVARHALQKDIANIHAKIHRCSEESCFYSILDLLYAGEINAAKQMCPPQTLQSCIISLSHPSEDIKLIYEDFANAYHIKKQFCEVE